jgi:hypothetical protein
MSCMTSTPAPTPRARARATETLKLERTFSDLVNHAYALTPMEIGRLWKTAPPRMRIPRPQLDHLSRKSLPQKP